MAVPRLGASPEDWRVFASELNLIGDLLPVVSNQAATISAMSAIKDLGKTPSMYNHKREVVGFTKWTSFHADADHLADWMKEPDYGICLQTRYARALDIDVEDPEQVLAISTLIETKLGTLPVRTRANSARRLYLFAVEGTLAKRAMKTEHGIVEFLANGQQCVVAGTHKSGVRYDWQNLDGLPVFPETLINEVWDALTVGFAIEVAKTTKAAQTRQEALQRALESDPNAAMLYEKGVVVGGDSGKLFIECPFKDEHSTDTGPSATAYFIAHTNGYANGHFQCMHAHCRERRDSDFLRAFGVITEPEIVFDVLPDPAALIPPLRARGRFTLQSVAGFVSAPPMRWLVKGFLPERGLVVIYGQPSCGKTFFTLDLVGRLALGQSWRGRKTIGVMNVTYICAEGVGGFRNRMKAFLDLIQLPDIPNMTVITDQPNILAKEDIGTLARLLGKTDIVVFDTFASVMPGDESSSEDMGLAVRNAQLFSRITGATVILVHHTPKDGAGMRGHSSLNGGADLGIEVTKFDDGDRAALVVKSKDGDCEGEDYGFRLSVAQIGTDSDGDPIKSCVIHNIDASAARAAQAAKGKKKKPAGGKPTGDEMLDLTDPSLAS